MAEPKKKTTKRKAEKKTEEQAESLRLFTTYDTAQALHRALEDYFLDCDVSDVYYGEAGMCNSIKVALNTFRGWFDGKGGPEFQEVAVWAYQKIASMFESNPDFCHDKVLSKTGNFMMKQRFYQNYKDRTEEKVEHKINVTFGKNMDADCFD